MTTLATLTLARLYAQQGSPEKAFEVCRKILDIDPDNEACLREMDSLRRRWPSFDSQRDHRLRLVAVNREIRLLETWIRRLTQGG